MTCNSSSCPIPTLVPPQIPQCGGCGSHTGVQGLSPCRRLQEGAGTLQRVEENSVRLAQTPPGPKGEKVGAQSWVAGAPSSKSLGHCGWGHAEVHGRLSPARTTAGREPLDLHSAQMYRVSGLCPAPEQNQTQLLPSPGLPVKQGKRTPARYQPELQSHHLCERED